MEQDKNTTRDLTAKLSEYVSRERELEGKILEKEMKIVACLELLDKAERKNTKLVSKQRKDIKSLILVVKIVV